MQADTLLETSDPSLIALHLRLQQLLSSGGFLSSCSFTR